MIRNRKNPKDLLQQAARLLDTGQTDRAFEIFKTVAALPAPHSIYTLYTLSQLPRSHFDVDILPLIDAAKPDGKGGREHFENLKAATYGFIHDNAGRYEEAWRYILASNVRPFQHNKAEYLKRFKLRHMVKSWLQEAPAVAHLEDAHEAPISLHILGTSRSGKTTLEKLVATLGGVTLGLETSIVQNALKTAFKKLNLPASAMSLELSEEIRACWRACYLAQLEKAAAGARIFTSAHPGNIRAVYQIAMALPNSRFVFMKRDIKDVCLRIYMKQYRSGNSYAYSLKNIIEYVNWYNEMVDLLAERFAPVCAVIRYEDMIDDPIATSNIVAKLCGTCVRQDVVLPWLGDDRGCARPYKTLMAINPGVAAR